MGHLRNQAVCLVPWLAGLVLLSVSACSVDLDGFVYDDDKLAEAQGEGDDDPIVSQECIDFCDGAEEICGFGTSIGYETRRDCLELCDGYFPTELDCRVTHLGFAEDVPENHCPHTLEDGGGQCPDAQVNSCDRFCLRAESACSFAEGDDERFGGRNLCQEACESFSGNGLECRFVELGKAENGSAEACRELLPDDGSACAD